jgi:DNA-binding beta-propeller fold protein YncE
MRKGLESERRWPGLVVLAMALCLVAGACTGGGRYHTRSPTRPASARPGSAGGGAVLVSSLARWRLPAPLSRAVALPDGGGVLLLGGLRRSQVTSDQILHLDLARGAATPAGRLAAPVHDAAAALLGGTAYVFGGGARQTTADVQAVAPGRPALLAGRLPAPRSDLAAVTVSGRVYLAGGYDGRAPSRAVLETADGTHFRTVARLPRGVRYPALAADGQVVYVLGGESAAGVESRAIQAIDLRSGTARVVGQLRRGLAHAAAVRLGGRIYLAGGRSGGHATDAVWRFDPATARVTPAGRLPGPVSDAAAVVAGGSAWLLGGEDGGQLATVTVLRLVARPSATAAADAPFQGRLLIADRGNDRLLLVDAARHVLWRYPSAGAAAPPGGFYYPDDAFFIRHGSAIISNQEGNETIVEIAFPSGHVLWRYGHPRVAGSRPGYLNEPDDAYLLRDGRVAVADARNCRVLLIGPRRTTQIGAGARCAHDPPRSLGAPNGDTPLADGNLLVSEIRGSWIDEISPSGRLVWSVHLPIAYPSDPQQLGPDLYLVADYTRPGGIVEFTREGRIVWVYRPRGGEAMLDHPSLAERLPGGRICVNDDYRHRVVVIDPATRRIVWQYGRTDRAGTGPGLLNTPDGFDLLLADGTTPTHPRTG